MPCSTDNYSDSVYVISCKFATFLYMKMTNINFKISKCNKLNRGKTLFVFDSLHQCFVLVIRCSG